MEVNMARPEANRPTDILDASPRHERISQRAFERFEARGGEHGRDQEDWFEAERELSQDRDREDRTIAGDVDARRLEPRDRDRSER
jgi:hypothetical protein